MKHDTTIVNSFTSVKIDGKLFQNVCRKVWLSRKNMLTCQLQLKNKKMCFTKMFHMKFCYMKNWISNIEFKLFNSRIHLFHLTIQAFSYSAPLFKKQALSRDVKIQIKFILPLIHIILSIICVLLSNHVLGPKP